MSAGGREGRRDVGFTSSARIICFIFYLSKNLSEVLTKSHEEGSLCCVPAMNSFRTMRALWNCVSSFLQKMRILF